MRTARKTNKTMSQSPYSYTDTADRIYELANDLSENMDWASTREGHDYWHEVYAKLLEHAEAAEMNPGRVPGPQRYVTGLPPPNAIPAPVVKQGGYREQVVESIHLVDKGFILCGIKFKQVVPRGHTFVGLKEKDKVTCPLCKSKLLNH